VGRGRVAIALPGDPEQARAVLARGRRIARNLSLEWFAVRVQPSPHERGESTQPLLNLVTALGGRLLCAEARDIATALVDLSRREQARILVIGASRRPRFLRRLKRGITERILEAKRPFDVVIAAEGVDR
jgi:two-component system, OmpR family, sensor histidine kinase KdpD